MTWRRWPRGPRQHLAERERGADNATPEAQAIIDALHAGKAEGGPQNCGACHH
ncbi:MAG: hypothetical protein AAFZ09_14535 [Pseudomonadota bacterium]